MNKAKQVITRRSFNSSAALGVATAAAPWIVPSSVFGNSDRAAPSERITLGFIGTGKMNLVHIGRLLKYKDVQVLAVCDVDTTRREHARQIVDDAYAKQQQGASSTQGCASYSDFRELIGRKEIDAVVIATPDHWHAIQAIQAAKAGKDVYCEKPMSLTITEAKRMIDVVRKEQCVFQTGSHQRSEYDGRFRLTCELVRSGRIGKVLSIHVGVDGPSKWCDLDEEPMELGLDWEMWLGPAPLRPYHSILSPRGVHDHWAKWRWFREYSGGSVTDGGAHHFDIAQWALDMDQSGPVEVIPPKDPSIGRGVKFVYENGVEMIHGGPGGLTFIGTDGMIRSERRRLFSDPAEIVNKPLEENEVHLPVSPGHYRDWLDCIRTRKRPICDVEIGARTVTVCHLGNLGYWYGRKLRWDPQKWEFVDDEQANQWRDRKRRDPWRLPEV